MAASGAMRVLGFSDERGTDGPSEKLVVRRLEEAWPSAGVMSMVREVERAASRLVFAGQPRRRRRARCEWPGPVPNLGVHETMDGGAGRGQWEPLERSSGAQRIP